MYSLWIVCCHQQWNAETNFYIPCWWLMRALCCMQRLFLYWFLHIWPFKFLDMICRSFKLCGIVMMLGSKANIRPIGLHLQMEKLHLEEQNMKHICCSLLFWKSYLYYANSSLKIKPVCNMPFFWYTTFSESWVFLVYWIQPSGSIAIYLCCGTSII